jgi:hypothetical protein
LIWGFAFGLMSAIWSTPRERPFVFTGAFVIAAAIGYLSMIPWRWRMIPRRWPTWLIFPANGAVALLMGVAVFFFTIICINFAVDGAAVLTPRRLRAMAWYSLYGMQFPVVGFYITVGMDLEHRGNIEAKDKQRLKRIAEQARLMMLRSQINPHFYVNALNTIAALIPSRPADAERAVELLATALRPVLTSDQPMLASLDQELKVAQAYAAIETLRFGERCGIHFEIEESALACRLPSLSLQPLLENAVRHGAALCSGTPSIISSSGCACSSVRRPNCRSLSLENDPRYAAFPFLRTGNRTNDTIRAAESRDRG